MWQGVDVTTTHRAFVSKLDINLWSMLDNLRLKKRANGGGSFTWVDVVAISRD